MEIEIIGVYRVDASEPCYLIECWLRGVRDDFDFGQITQECPGEPEDNWQVPWNEYRLNDNGTGGDVIVSTESLRGDVRVAFFIDYLDLGRPLKTPAGELVIPAPTNLPERLSFVRYEPPC